MAQINQTLCRSQHGELRSVAEERGHYEGDAKRLGRKVSSVHFLVPGVGRRAFATPVAGRAMSG